jgi:gliding motility-associated-like protein
MKKLCVSLIALICSLHAFASHISGGELFYEYLGAGSSPNTDLYKITMRLFRECSSSGQQLDGEKVTIGIYNRSDNTLFTTLFLNQQWSGPVPRLENTPGVIPCLTGDASLCYQIGTFSNTISLPRSPNGYILSWVRCCRQNTDNLNDEPFETNAAGATFVTQIPGTNLLPDRANNSPQFVIKDTALVCAGNEFKLDFSAIDKDGDSLSYGFCDGYNGGSLTVVNPAPFPVLSLVPLTYLSPYSGSFPLGPDVTINAKSGIISGNAPSAPGKYVVNVCVYEWKNKDTLLNTHRKDFILKVGDCDFTAAELKPSYITCDGFTLTFANESTSANIHSYYWEFGDPNSATDSSTNPTPTYTYKDSGTYPVKLVINKGEQCSDSTTSSALVYPGFIPGFKVNGSCFFNPYQFIDLTTTKYGIVDSWRWDFGDPSVTTDTSLLQNPSYKYPNVDSLNVRLIVTNSKGCTDTLIKSIVISDKPDIILPFHDTLICNIDSLQLHASTTDTGADFTWTPAININNINSPDPIVSPQNQTTYAVTVNDKGCINTDSVKVNVISSVDLFAGTDTTICLTDTIQLRPVTNGLHFTWSPATGLSDPAAKNPFVVPLSATQYHVVASVGKCSTADDINIRVAPYPVANAGTDTSICFGATTVLKGTSSAASFAWSPSNSLLHANTLTPLAGPQSTTTYTLTVMDSIGCPKPGSDTVTVHVIPRIPAFAGRDTTIVAGEPLQMNASGGTVYSWSPVTGMDNPNIPNPIIILSTQYDSMTYRVKVGTPEGCYAYDDVKVTVFKTQPDIFIPSGFTPNSDGLNDVLRPKVVGMKQFNYFKVFDRWGVMVFSTTQEGKGWDGTYSGTAQASGAYVFVAQAVDYTGKLITKKGTVVLIR